MKPIALVLLAAMSLGSLWRDTNSHAAAVRGADAYAKQQYAQSVASYQKANQLAPSAQNAFNLGTAEIAAGQREAGSAVLAEAIRDPALRADALYNRGNSALAAKALDHAIRDYIDALKANPHHAQAKRNLEIAQQRKEQQQRQQSQGGQGQQGQQQPKQPAPAPGKQQKPGEMDLQALLRSVQQQEQEELRRMKAKAGVDGRVGW
jgi:tetratricopeptide (TPR) repeat protein